MASKDKDGSLKVLYNELVLIALIEQDYIKSELSSKNDYDRYIRFLENLLKSNKQVKL